MLFNSYQFIIVFLPITLFVYFLCMKLRNINISLFVLSVASLIFYAYWDARYLILLIASIVFNYYIGQKISKSHNKFVMIFGVCTNLSVLIYYKYTKFFLSSLNGIGFHFESPEIILPLGISFFTFTQIAYLVDAYKQETSSYGKSSYFLFVTFFPHLIAGPILYHKDIIPQFNDVNNQKFNWDNFAHGFCFFIFGLLKKMLVADTLSIWVKAVFDSGLPLSSVEAWCGALSYTMQIYFDFSAYSEMALGLGLMLNIKLPINFYSPYKSLSIIEFWRRWHITLSQFLKNYLYIPLGGNRKGEFRKYFNLFVTMLLGGLWHGAGWTFIIWGGIHGIYLVINHFWKRLSFSIPKFLSWLLTFISVVNAWVFFRSNSTGQAVRILKAMYGFADVNIWGKSFKEISKLPCLVKRNEFFILCILCIVVRYLPSVPEILLYKGEAGGIKFSSLKYKINFSIKEAIVIGVLAFVIMRLMFGTVSNEFLYFNF